MTGVLARRHTHRDTGTTPRDHRRRDWGDAAAGHGERRGPVAISRSQAEARKGSTRGLRGRMALRTPRFPTPRLQAREGMRGPWYFVTAALGNDSCKLSPFSRPYELKEGYNRGFHLTRL